MAEFDYSRLKDYKFYKVFLPVARVILHIIYRFKIIGEENLPKEGGYIIACNHVVALDPVFLASNRVRVIHFMAKSEFFQNPVKRWLMTHMNSFPVKRDSTDKSSVSYAIRLVNEGNVLGIFPEGKRSKTYAPDKPKSGVALIANITGADVVPASVYMEKKFCFRKKVTVRFGEVIRNEELGFTEGEKKTSELRAASRKIFDEIVKLWRKGHWK